MAKITVCDICKSNGKLTETTTYMRVKGKKDLRLDYCNKCKKDIPTSIKEYTEFVRKINGKVFANECKYCGQDNGSADENVLCSECRETFGHALYSEL